jgi:hypothetical protein
MTERCQERYVKYRGETIARTESLRAVHQGSQEMFQQAVDNGIVDPGNITRTWNSSRTMRQCAKLSSAAK